MNVKKNLIACCAILMFSNLIAQDIGDFTSVNPVAQTAQFVIPSSHTFQVISETDDALTEGGTFKVKPDFTAYVPIGGSSINGYLSINSEGSALTDGGGGVMVFDINFNGTSKLWETTASEDLDFSGVGDTAANCSGTVTPWNTIISSEEYPSIAPSFDFNLDGYNDLGWNVEIDPVNKVVLNKLWAMGNFAHENVTIHSNHRTVYQGADEDIGYLYKFVATIAQNLNDGLLYVYTGSKSGTGTWTLLNNTTKAERNSTTTQSANAGATVFDGIEDVEIGPNGWVYFAVKGESQVYRFQDADPIVVTGTDDVTMETFVGNMSYMITHDSGTDSVAWGSGNDNLAFDNEGNLWVLQDGGNNYIWVVGNTHTQGTPVVKIFGISPIGSEPTGITFTPDFKYLFMSIMHPDVNNLAGQMDAAGNTYDFELGTTLVISLTDNLGVLAVNQYELYPNKTYMYPNPSNSDQELIIKGKGIENVKLYSIYGQLIKEKSYNFETDVKFKRTGLAPGVYILQVNNKESLKLIFK